MQVACSMQVSSGRMHEGDDTFRVIQGIRSCQVSPLRPHLLTASLLMQSPSSLSPAAAAAIIITAITFNDRHMHTRSPSQQMVSRPLFLRRDNKTFRSHLFFPHLLLSIDSHLSYRFREHGFKTCICLLLQSIVNQITVIIRVASVCPILREGSPLMTSVTDLLVNGEAGS